MEKEFVHYLNMTFFEGEVTLLDVLPNLLYRDQTAICHGPRPHGLDDGKRPVGAFIVSHSGHLCSLLAEHVFAHNGFYTIGSNEKVAKYLGSIVEGGSNLAIRQGR